MDSHLDTPALAQALAPSGTLRASINLGNPMLAVRSAPDAAPAGVSVDLARALARAIGRPLELVVFDKAAASVEAVRHEQADVGFFAIDPARAEGLAFSAAYLWIEGSYAVAQDSGLRDNAEVDRPGVRIAVGSGSAYDLYLSREIRQAHIERVQGAAGVVAQLRAGQVDVGAGIRQVLEAEAGRAPGLRLLPGRFMVIQQAMGLPASRGAAAAAALARFVEARKAEGFVAEALLRHGIGGASVAPAPQAQS